MTVNGFSGRRRPACATMCRMEDEIYELRYTRKGTRDGLYAYGLKVEARLVSAPPGLSDTVDAGLFVYRRSTPFSRPGGSSDGCEDVFVNVVTPVDFVDIPYGSPSPEKGMPYYRSDSLDLWFRNSEDVDRAMDDIDADVAGLARSLRTLSFDWSNDFGDSNDNDSDDGRADGRPEIKVVRRAY